MDIPAQPLPETVSDHDLHLFQYLTMIAAHGAAPAELAEMLRAELDLSQIAISHPDDAPPPGDRVVIAPLYFGGGHLADLCAEVPSVADSVTIAARLLFFAPIIALAIASQHAPDATAPAWGSTAQQERDRLEAVLDATNDAILMIDTSGVLVTATLQFETFTGLPRYEMLGKPLELLARQIEAQPGLPQGMASVLRALAHDPTESLGGELEIDEPHRRILVWYSLPVHAQSGTLLGRIFAFRDVTREREVDQLKTEFITLVSHELRTPLTSVKGFSDLILESGEETLPAEIQEYLHIIALNADRLVTLINDILDVTRIETDRVELSPTLCPLHDVIWQVAASMQPMLQERGHRLTLDLPARLPPVWADPTRMAQIVTNLLGNAIKYTLQPGQIVVGARYVQALSDLPGDAHRDQILPCVLVSVRDTGQGIAPVDRPHLFKRFYRANNEAARLVGGTGLGLMIVKSFVEMHGGQVWFHSQIGRGSTFYFTVPVVESKTLPEEMNL